MEEKGYIAEAQHRVCVPVCTHIYACVCACVFVYVYMYVCLCSCMCVLATQYCRQLLPPPPEEGCLLGGQVDRQDLEAA